MAVYIIWQLGRDNARVIESAIKIALMDVFGQSEELLVALLMKQFSLIDKVMNLLVRILINKVTCTKILSGIFLLYRI